MDNIHKQNKKKKKKNKFSVLSDKRSRQFKLRNIQIKY